MVFITLHGGANEIGGNKVLVEDRDTRVFFDFGEPFGLKDRYFTDYLMPRESRFGLRDYFHFDLLPRIQGLYDSEWLDGTDLKHSPAQFDGIFVSHMHYDHVMHLKFADKDIPVYMGSAASTIMKSWRETSLGKVNFGDHEFRTFRTGDKVKIGCFEVEPIHVDHSTPGAYGFLIHTPGGCVAYTGDLRLHGPRKDMTREFIEKARAERPIALVCEGTRVAASDPRKNFSEDGVRQRALDLISRSKRLAIVSFYPKDVDRMRTFRDVAKATGRKFVVSAKVANLLNALKGDPKIVVPDPLKDPNMLVYVREMASPEKVRYEFEYVKLKGSNDHIVDSHYVKTHQDELIYHTDFTQLAELIDIAPKEGSLFIRSMSEPFEEDDVQEEVLKNWIRSFRLSFHQAHASGHASMHEIFQIVRQISPAVVLPIHTARPDMFSACKKNLLCPGARNRVKIA